MSLTANTLAPDALARLHLAHVFEHGRAVQAAAIAVKRASDEVTRAAFEAAMLRAAARLGAATDALGRECASLAREGYGALVTAIRAEYERGRHEFAEGHHT